MLGSPTAITRVLCLSAAPEQVWSFVSDTDRTNRATGASEVLYSPVSSAQSSTSAARFTGRTRAGIFDLTYDELPFEWSYARSLRVERRMHGGPVTRYSLAWSLEPIETAEGGTRVTLALELSPRSLLLRPIVWLHGRAVVARLLAFAKSIDAFVRDREHAASPFAAPRSSVNETQLAAGVAALARSGVAPNLARRIGTYLSEASDADLVRIRPFELADAFETDRQELLRAMLHGVPSGLFEMRWAIICPSCQTASALASTLDEVKSEGHCQLCDITFELELDRAIEATFVPHEAVRTISEQFFCMAGPSRTPHVWAQANLEPNDARHLVAPRELGRYRLFARGGSVASVEVTLDALPSASLTVGDAAIRPAKAEVAPGGSLLVTNGTALPRHVKLERLNYASDAATAHHLSTVEEFRRLFSSDLLKPGTPLKVSRVAILFSDLTGSTALYSKLGDAAAFRIVDDHFDILKPVITRHGGVIVKTMGDAVMAAFRDASECVRAAAEALAEFERFRESTEHGSLIGLKLGATSGPCYVVTANAQLDYFGQTVNVAARVQHLAGSGEIVVPHALFAALAEGGRPTLRVMERFQAQVKGVDAPLDLVRLELATAKVDDRA